MEFQEALKEILKIKGASALEDENTLKLLEDYGAFEEHPVYRSILETIIVMKIGEMLQKTFYYFIDDKGLAWNQMRTKLIEGLPFDDIFIESFLDDLEAVFLGYACERGTSERDLKTDVEEMLGQVWIDDRGVKYSSDKKRLINASEVDGMYAVNPETEYIESHAFQHNRKIEHIILPKELKKIGSLAFNRCYSLKKIDFQGELSEIGEHAFGGCNTLKEIHLPNGLKQISDGLFSVCANLLYIHIPMSVTHIGMEAFADCHSLQYVQIPEQVTSIGSYAFKWCKSLYYVILPSNITSVGDNIFDNCRSLRYIGIPKGTKSKYSELMPQYADLFIEYSKNEAESKKISKVTSYKEGCGLRTILKDGHYYVVDHNNNYIVPPGKYDYIDGFDKCGLARVKIDGKEDLNDSEKSTYDKWGLIDSKGDEVLPLEYSEIWSFYNKNRKSTKVWKGDFVTLLEEGNFQEEYREKVYRYDFELFTHDLKLKEDWSNGEYDCMDPDYCHDSSEQYNVWDALDGEPEAAGNIDYEG